MEHATAQGIIVETGWVKLEKTNRILKAYSKYRPFFRGDRLVVNTPRGQVLSVAIDSSQRSTINEIGEIVEVTQHLDIDEYKKLKQDLELKEARAKEIFKRLVKESELSMKLSQVEYSIDQSKVVFYFTAPSRVDFRQLVKDLARELRVKIELRQIGVRDESKALGGVGICGLPLCCANHLMDFVPVSLKYTKVQGLTNNPEKVSGVCGRLMCCLAYEMDVYMEKYKDAPLEGKKVVTPDGPGRVKELFLLKDQALVSLEEGNIKTYPISALKWDRGNKSGDKSKDIDNG